MHLHAANYHTRTRTHAIMFPCFGCSLDAALCSKSSDGECRSQEVRAVVESSLTSSLKWLPVVMLTRLQLQEKANGVN